MLSFVWRSQRADAPQCVHFTTDICCGIQEDVITVEKIVRTKARQRVRRATHCHLDKTNMDKTSQHPLNTMSDVRQIVLYHIF